LIAVTLLLVVWGATAARNRAEPFTGAGNAMAGITIDEAVKQHGSRLMAVPGVVGVAVSQCDGKPCIRVLVVEKTPELVSKMPSTLEGYPVVLEETGPIRPLDRG
jgi:hypothetical protein